MKQQNISMNPSIEFIQLLIGVDQAERFELWHFEDSSDDEIVDEQFCYI